MNVEIRTEAAQFPEKEYIYGIFVALLVLLFLLSCLLLIFIAQLPAKPSPLLITALNPLPSLSTALPTLDPPHPSPLFIPLLSRAF